MIKFSKLADYAVVVLSILSKDSEKLMSASELSHETLLPEPTVAKVLKLLAKGGVVQSVRGVNGGYQITRPASQISMKHIIEAVDGPVAITTCVEKAITGGKAKSKCDYSPNCPIRGRWSNVNESIAQALSDVYLTEMMDPEIVEEDKQEKCGCS